MNKKARLSYGEGFLLLCFFISVSILIYFVGFEMKITEHDYLINSLVVCEAEKYTVIFADEAYYTDCENNKTYYNVNTVEKVNFRVYYGLIEHIKNGQ